jgi:hypothetical protein
MPLSSGMRTDDAACYLILRPHGHDGPYSLADLRMLAEAGRLRPEDRLLDTASRMPSTAAQLIPGLVGTNSQARVRRTRTSDRLPAQSTAPKPKPAEAEQQVSAAVAPDAVQGGKPPSRRRLWRMLLLAAAAVGAAITLATLVLSLRQPEVAVLVPDGRWTLAGLPRYGGPWSIDVAPAGIAIRSPDGSTQVCTWSITERDEQHCIVRLDQAHPVLGTQLVFVIRSTGPALSVPDGDIPAEHIPPL